MVGGRIVSITETPDRIRVIVAENLRGVHDSCGVDCAKTGHPLALGDMLWWQGGSCYWTPKGQNHPYDIPIPKIGYSYSVGLTP